MTKARARSLIRASAEATGRGPAAACARLAGRAPIATLVSSSITALCGISAGQLCARMAASWDPVLSPASVSVMSIPTESYAASATVDTRERTVEPVCSFASSIIINSLAKLSVALRAYTVPARCQAAATALMASTALTAPCVCTSKRLFHFRDSLQRFTATTRSLEAHGLSCAMPLREAGGMQQRMAHEVTSESTNSLQG